MKWERDSRSWGLLAVALSVGGCSGKSDEGFAGRGSEACHEWQAAYCDFAVGCGRITADDCRAMAQGIPCASDQAALDCASRLSAASCGAPPFPECGAAAMSDREEVRQACETLFEAYCNQAVSCGAGSQAECLASIEDAGGCSPMIGYKEGYEACLSIWQGPQLACGDLKPQECKDVLTATE